jgi:hypothetical protein
MWLHLLTAAVLLQGLSGIGGGVALVADPSGAALGLPVTLLAESPFRDYFFPGLILLVLLGIAPLIVAWGLWRRRGWSWYGSVHVGTALLVWITVQIFMIGYSGDPPLQAHQVAVEPGTRMTW